MWNLRLLVMLGAAMITSTAQADFVDYAKWKRLADPQKEFYVVGVLDGWMHTVKVVENLEKLGAFVPVVASHYNDVLLCVLGRGMKSDQLTAIVDKFLKDTPDLRDGKFASIVFLSLHAACN